MIWPPFSRSFNLPLGIPFLVAYLKEEGTNKVAVFDMNMAYLMKSPGISFPRNLKRLLDSAPGLFAGGFRRKAPGGNVRRDAEPESLRLGSPPAGGDRSSLRSLLSGLNLKLEERLDRLIEARLGKIDGMLPWSLDDIVGQALEENHPADGGRLSGLLRPVLRDNPPGLIGLSAIYPEQLFFSLRIARIVKEEFSEPPIVVIGGAQVSKHERYLTSHRSLADFVDFFVTGDGEASLAGLVTAGGVEDISGVPNLYFRPAEGGETFRKTVGEFVLLPSDFPVPDFSGFDSSLYHNWWPVLASKGCFWGKCRFCTYAALGGQSCRLNPLENTLRIISGMKGKYGVENFRFVDDALPPKYMEKLAGSLIDGEFNIRWRSSLVLSGEFAEKRFCQLLYRSGLRRVTIGLESISPRVLKLMNKYHRDMKESEIEQVIASLTAAGIKVGLHIIFGFPTETVAEARRTLEFLVRKKDFYDVCWVQPFCLEEDTLIFNSPDKFGIAEIFTGNKDSGERLGYRYRVSEGMSQQEASDFTYREALPALRKAGVAK